MKNLILPLAALFYGLFTHAQTEVFIGEPINFESITEGVQYPKVTVFTYGQDTLRFELNCSANDSEIPLTPNEVSFKSQEVQVLDSMDLNGDGFKELFIYRAWSCSTSPELLNEYGVGSSSENIGQHEVWDIHNKNKLFEFVSNYWYQFIQSTNVVSMSSYNYKLHFEANGNINYVQLTGMREGEKNKGTYKYDQKSGTYILK